MTTIDTPTSHVRLAIGRCDITPPVGIYHRMWGAATHEQATGVHRPLFAGIMAVGPPDDKVEPIVILALDHCLLFPATIQALRSAVGAQAGVPEHNVLVAFSHTHAAGFMDPSRADRPGGNLIQPYLDQMSARIADLVQAVKARLQPAVITYGQGTCTLAGQRDFWDEASRQFVCGFNPGAPADATVLVALMSGPDSHPLAALVNYACHPTTLAFQNTLISPDYVGAMRQTVENVGPPPHRFQCLFLQGASGDLGPRHGFVGDTWVAERNGRQLGHAALSALEALPPPDKRFVYQGPVVSGATLGIWDYQDLDEAGRQRAARWAWKRLTVELPYRPDLPTLNQVQQDLAAWQEKKTQAQQAGDDQAARDAHAMIERHQRMHARLQFLPPGPVFPAEVHIILIGGACWVFLEGELYQWFQTHLRGRFPGLPIIVATLTNGWRCSYIPTRETYGKGIYQESIALLAPGSLELLEERVAGAIKELIED